MKLLVMLVSPLSLHLIPLQPKYSLQQTPSVCIPPFSSKEAFWVQLLLRVTQEYALEQRIDTYCK
jgi:hypothetical protein